MKKSLLLSTLLGVTMFSCQNNELTPTSSALPEKSARTVAVVYSNNFETSPIGWSVYVWSWSTANAVTYAGSKKIDQANLLATVRPRTYLVKYQTSSAINFPSSGNYTLTFSTITTPTSIANSGIDIVLVDAVTGLETIIGSVPLLSTATPLTTRNINFSIAAGKTSQFLKLVSKSTATTTSPTLAGHCYFDDIVIQ